MTNGWMAANADGTSRRPGNFLIRSREHWIAEGIGYAVPDVPSDRFDLLDHRQTAAYGEVLRTIVRFVRTQTAAPSLGADNEEILGGLLGMSTAELARLHEAGVVN